ncbi:MAG: hypothetical protein GXO82_01980 [Chlorobi bacterium]|nr:hypothetical protein [Chlorobiota bacterium]
MAFLLFVYTWKTSVFDSDFLVGDGVWAKYWYGGVHRSTGFKPYRPKSDPFPERLKPLLEECRPYYERLRELAIPAD